MKTYIKPTSEPINVANEEIMDGMSIPFIGNDPTQFDEELLIKNGDEVLNNEDNVWDTLNDGWQ